VLDQYFDHSFWIVDIVVGIEFEFLEFRILAHEILDGVFESFDDFGEFLFSRRSFDIEDDLVIDSQFLGDRQGIVRRTSMIKMVDGNFGHAGNLGARNNGATAI